jgi:Flp pilus assembly protein TadG
MRGIGGGIDNRRGATIVLVAAATAALLGMTALAVDLSMLFKVRSDAQRAADAAALAGASAYLNYPEPLDARVDARDRARSYAAQNYVGDAIYVDTVGEVTTYEGDNLISVSNEALVQVLPGEEKVRVTVRRRATATWFARILGVGTVPISAKAAAVAMEAGGAKCVKPFALADLWQENDTDISPDGSPTPDLLWDAPGEEWSYDPTTDHYMPYKGDPAKYITPPETGYGSEFRNYHPTGSTVERDYGRQIIVKPQDPQVDQMITPGNFFAWDMPNDTTNTSTCGIGGGGGGGENGGGATEFSKYICSCNNNVVTVGDGAEYPVKNGNMKQATVVGVQDLVDLDPGAVWNPTSDGGRGAVMGSAWTNWLDSPRVIKIALYDPAELYKSGKIDISFTNIALMFIEDIEKKDAAVTARFITYAQGAVTPGPGGPLVKVLRLVE